MIKRTPRSVILAALLLGAAAALPAQEPTPGTTVRESVEVHVINVDVAVVDSAGRPVLGLTAADFALEEDGAGVPLSNFFAWDEPANTPASAPTPGPQQPAAPADDEQSLRLVVLVDNAHISFAGRRSVFDGLAKALNRSLRTGDKVMLVSYGQSFREHHAFTADHKAIATALAALGRETAEGVITANQWNRLLREIANAERQPPGAAAPYSASTTSDYNVLQQRVLFDIQAFAEEQYSATHAMIKILANFVDSLAGLPGRKALLWVSEGISRRPGAELMQEWQTNFPEAARDLGFNASVEAEHYSLAHDFLELTRRANSGRVMLYTIDAAVNRGMEGWNADQTSMVTLVGLAGTEVMNRRKELIDFATATGGTAVVNTTHLDETLGDLVSDSRSGYSLGFQPGHFGDGRYHRLKVQVKREGVVARYREGYLDKSAEQRLADRTGATLLEDGGDNPLELQVFVGESTRRGDDSYLVPLTLRIPSQDVVLMPADGGAEAQLSVCFVVKDADGRSSEAQPRSVPLKISSGGMAAFQRVGAELSFQLVMRKGPQRVAVTVRDELSLQQSSVIVKLRVPTQG
jgi:VWFA-related protein